MVIYKDIGNYCDGYAISMMKKKYLHDYGRKRQLIHHFGMNLEWDIPFLGAAYTPCSVENFPCYMAKNRSCIFSYSFFQVYVENVLSMNGNFIPHWPF